MKIYQQYHDLMISELLIVIIKMGDQITILLYDTIDIRILCFRSMKPYCLKLKNAFEYDCIYHLKSFSYLCTRDIYIH